MGGRNGFGLCSSGGRVARQHSREGDVRRMLFASPATAADVRNRNRGKAPLLAGPLHRTLLDHTRAVTSANVRHDEYCGLLWTKLLPGGHDGYPRVRSYGR